MPAYAARSSSNYSINPYSALNAATLQMQAQTIATIAAMENTCALVEIRERLSALVPSAAPQLHYLVDRTVRGFGDIISELGYR